MSDEEAICSVRASVSRIAGRGEIGDGRAALRVGCRAVSVLCIALLPSGCVAVREKVVEPVLRAVAEQRVEQGERLVKRKAWDQARVAFERAAAADPKNAEAHARLARLLARGRDDRRACAEYRAALRADPDNLDDALALGDCLCRLAETSMDRQQLYAAAVRVFQYARSIKPADGSALMHLGACYRQMGDDRQAIAILREAERLNPGSTSVHNELAAAYETIGDDEQALAQYAAALAIDPDNLLAHNRAGEINLRISERGGAGAASARRRALAHFALSMRIDAAQPQVRQRLLQLGDDAMRVAQSPGHGG